LFQDIGGILPECSAIDNIVPTFPSIVSSVPTGASELLRNNLQDILDFLTDCNTLTKLKVYYPKYIYFFNLYAL